MRKIATLPILLMAFFFVTLHATQQRQQTPAGALPGQRGQPGQPAAQRGGGTPPRPPIQPGQTGVRPTLEGPLPSTPVTTVYRADTGEPVAGARVRPMRLEIPNAFDKPCKARTVTDVSEGLSVMTDRNGRFTLPTVTATAPPIDGPQTQIAQDETARQILEMERLRLLAERGVPAVAQERLELLRIPQATVDLITVPNTVPLAARNGVQSGLIAEREGFVQTPWSDLVLAPAPTISGRIVDPNNKPVAGAVVQVYEVRFRPLGRTMKWVKSTLTNDLGEYRLSWLPYGWYTIAAGNSDYTQQPWMEALKLSPNLPQPDAGLPLLFYPGVENASDAGLIHIRYPALGDTNAGMPTPIANLALKERPRFNVKVRLAGKEIPANPNLVVVPAGGDVCATMDYAIKADADGTFDVRGLPRGRYEMVAISGRDVISPLMPVKVEQDIDDLKLAVTSPVTVQGTVTFEGLPPGTDINLLLGEIRVSLTRSRSEVSQVSTNVADPRTFNFSIPGVGPGSYYPTLNLPPGAFVKDIRALGIRRTGRAEEDWTCDALPSGAYSYLDTHGHLEPLEIPEGLATGNPKEFLCLKVDVAFSGEMGGLAWTWTPCWPVLCPLPRALNPGMAVLMPRSAWQKSNDNGVTPPDRILVVDASRGSYKFYGVPLDDYRLYAVEYPNAELIYRPEFNEWFGALGVPLLFDFVTPCPVSSVQASADFFSARARMSVQNRCDVIAPAHTTVNDLVP